MEMKYKVEPHVVKNLFTKSSHTFRVPEFQRNYVWKVSEKETSKRHVNLFLEDMDNSRTDDENYYIGNIITYSDDTVEHLLVDGQQRITTLALLFLAFRDFQNESYEDIENIKKVDEHLKFTQQHQGKEKIKHRLVVANTSGDNFISNLIEGTSLRKIEVSVGSREMLDSYKLCKKFLQDKGLEEATKYIEFVETRVEISWIKASDIESAFIVFDRMNDRGENLTVSDKFKYLLFQSTDPENLMNKSSQINNDWETIQNSLEQIKAKIDNFLNYYLAAKHFTDKWPSKSAMISWIRQKGNREKIGINEPVVLLKELQDDAAKFKEFWRGNDINGNPIYSLNLIKSHASEVRQHIPLLMAASAGRYNKEDFEKLAVSIEKLVFALKLSGSQWNVVNTFIPGWCTKLRKKQNIEKFINENINPEIESRAIQMSANLTNMKNMGPKLRRYVLDKINYILCEESAEPHFKESTEGKKREVTIEHILSQSFPDSDLNKKLANENREILEKNIWRLGNLTLLERVSNSAASNKTVKQKFDENTFGNSKIVLSRLIQVKNFSGESALGKKETSKHNTVLKKYEIELVKLTDDKYFGLNQIYQREEYLFGILSSFFGVELKTINL
jgi:uncharacterized protein with ParB-like and HNH nuclease domain